MAIGFSPKTTAMFGNRIEVQRQVIPIGHRIVTGNGVGFRLTVGRGLMMSRGVGRLIITGVGFMTTVGIGRLTDNIAQGEVGGRRR